MNSHGLASAKTKINTSGILMFFLSIFVSFSRKNTLLYMIENFHTLSDLHRLIKDALSVQFSESIWFVAEISEIRTNYSGHCYLELIEKDEKDENITSKIRGTIWAYHYRMMKPYFETQTGQELRNGLKVLFKGKVEHHELYGLSVNINDIDPTYTIGEQEKKKNAILQKLFDDGIIDMNKELEFPLLPQRVAVISSETAAGFGDFKNQITSNKNNYYISLTLFPAVMQGEKTKNSILAAFHVIYEEIDNFDIVVLIRGGGATSDLIWFDDYDIAQHIAQFPIPVIAGIGHERDETIADLVAHFSVKTPTAAAEIIIDSFRAAESEIDNFIEQFQEITDTIIEKENRALMKAMQFFPLRVNACLNNERETLYKYGETTYKQLHKSLNKSNKILENQSKNIEILLQQKINDAKSDLTNKRNDVGKQVLSRCREIGNRMDNYIQKISLGADFFIKNKKLTLDKYTVISESKNPEHVLKQGYAIIAKNGKIVKNVTSIEEGEEVEAILHDGSFVSKVLSKKSE